MTRRKNRTKSDRKPRPPLAVSHGDRFRPWLLGGTTALFVARPLFPSESAATYGDGLTMVMLWIALAVFWLLGAIGRPKFSIRFGWTDAAVLLLVGWHTVAALWAAGHGSPRPAVNMLWEWVGMGLCFLLARQFIATAREVRAVAVVMVALAVALSGYGLYQYAYEMPNTRAKYEADPDRTMRDAGLWFPAGSPERQLFENRLSSKEPIATFALTNSLAGYLAPWLVMLVGMMGGTGRNRKRLLGMLLCGTPIAVCLLLTKSRSGYIATGVGLVLVWLLCRERTVRLGWKMPAAVVGIVAVLVTIVVAVRGVDREVLSQASKSFGYRLQYWQSSLQMIADHPIVGCGPGNFQDVYPQYKLPEASEEVADPHNFLLEIGATAGTPAMLAFLAVLGCFAWTMWRGEGRGTGDEKRGGATAGLSSSAENTVGQANRGTPDANPQSLIPNPSYDAWPYVLAGGACGFLLSVPVGLLSAAPPGVAAVLLGLPLAAATVMLLLGWIRDGWLPRVLPAVGVAVLLVDLLASGGIGLPSVAGTLWLLMALGLQGDCVAQPPSAVAHDSHSRGRLCHILRQLLFNAWTALLVAIALALACYGTAYNPVLGCQAHLRRAEREPARAVEHLEAAAAADPWAAEPWRQLAAIEFESWWQQPDEDAFDRFERASEKVLELAPHCAPAWLAAGDWYFRAFSKTDQRGEIEEAVEAYRHAVQLYPHCAVYRAKLAEACRAAGDQAAFRHEAEAALWLDDATPHIDKKLPADVRDRLLQGIGGKL